MICFELQLFPKTQNHCLNVTSVYILHCGMGEETSGPSYADFLTMRGPTLSPVSVLCFAWLPSQYGNFLDFQHLQKTPLSPISSISTVSTTLAQSILTVVLTRFSFIPGSMASFSLTTGPTTGVLARPWRER